MLSKQYLQCRMERNLMAKDELKNLGYAEDGVALPEQAAAVASKVTGVERGK